MAQACHMVSDAGIATRLWEWISRHVRRGVVVGGPGIATRF